MSKPEFIENDFIQQLDRIGFIQTKLGKETWFTVYENSEEGTQLGHGSFCAYFGGEKDNCGYR